MNRTPSTSKTNPKKRLKNRRSMPHGRVYICASFNNTIITVADLSGNVLIITSAGACGFRSGRKGTAYAAQVAANQIITQAINNFNLKKADIYVKGIGQGRESAMRTILNKGLQIDLIIDRTTIPHGGVRPRKARRV